MPESRLRLFALASVLMLSVLVSCGRPSAANSPVPSAATVPESSIATTDATPIGLCRLLSEQGVTGAVGSPVRVVGDASSETVCTYRATTNTLDVALRVEDTFETLASVQDVFADGSTEAVGEGAYWAPAVATLWFTHTGQIYAVQVIGDVAPERARQMAVELAQLALSGS